MCHREYVHDEFAAHVGDDFWSVEYRHRRHGGFTYLYGSDNFGIWLFE